MITQETVLSRLREVLDPDLGVNVVDLGLIRDVEIDDHGVLVRMVLTAPGCPFAGYLLANVRGAVEAIPGAGTVAVRLVDDSWEPSVE